MKRENRSGQKRKNPPVPYNRKPVNILCPTGTPQEWIDLTIAAIKNLTAVALTELPINIIRRGRADILAELGRQEGRKRQSNCDAILDKIIKDFFLLQKTEPRYEIFITDKDLYSPGLNFCFGIGTHHIGCVFSFHRFKKLRKLGMETAKTLLMHELGHTFGLPARTERVEEKLGTHCINPGCLMRQAMTLEEAVEYTEERLDQDWLLCQDCKIDLTKHFWRLSNPLNMDDFIAKTPPIKNTYNFLLPHLPEYMDVLNVCLVLGGIRSGTLVSPLNLAGKIRGINENALRTAVAAYPEIALRRFGDSFLIYDHLEQEEVDLLPPILDKQMNNDPRMLTRLGAILDYHCAGNLGGRYLVSYETSNPRSQNPNAFFSYMCHKIEPWTVKNLENTGKDINYFFRDVDLDFPVTLVIYDTQELVPEENQKLPVGSPIFKVLYHHAF